jgi:tagaturonate reductase
MVKKLSRETAGIFTNRPVKVLQFGEGNFLRAFVDWIIDILNEKANFNGDIQIIQPIAQGMGDLVNGQDGLYHVVLNGIKNGKALKETRLITSVRGVINPYNDFSAFLKLAENPDLEFVISNTTEAGISFSETDGSPDQLANSFPGKLTQLLYHRFNHFKGDKNKSLTIIPCELIDKNGTILKSCVLQFIQHWKLSNDFKTWVEENILFCNSLVDRIVPGFPKETINEIQNELGYSDNLVVCAEPFLLWVIEAPEKLMTQFPTNKTDLQVKFVKDLTAYRTRKVRILNGAHTAMVPVAYLYGVRTVKESVEDELISKYIKDVIYKEIIPTLDLPAEELNQFANDVLERFLNPFIKHELSSIALNSISKFKTRVLPSILEYQRRAKKLPPNLVFTFAALIRFYKGDYHGVIIPVQDSSEIIEFFNAAWKLNDQQEITKQVLANSNLWGENLNDTPGLTELTAQYVSLIDKEKWSFPG